MANDNMMGIDHSDGYDLGAFHFLKAGWWITHIIGIAAVFYIGYYFAAH